MNSSAKRIALLAAWWLLCWTLPATAAGDDAARRAQVLAMFEQYKAEAFADTQDIHPEAVLGLLQRGVPVVLVDSRDAKEQAVSMLPGAVTEAQFLAQPELHHDAIVVAYCTIGYRSGVFARKMASQGVSVLNLYGGMLNWTHAAGPLVDAQGRPVSRLHVYDSTWDLASAGVEGIY
ncbi:rhodanese-like domain-containing protein [Megalodesulfovibrio gigas]|uniref:Putative rhodanese-like domain protein n=1 Tax=Megalodesulfovibrio gigas (strain ATCC 19364 / DSM 1382 / NCIMB 9332 / VKM B-1759) TaxID=1121448 RepID=T2GBQ8_MEGG1|nr:rhodanese-like domain-containing protein [Megalodesulfovibrio gigas]AGW13589.1 putative rhodanese-like domain protein [Megalodesulfovibrio gigas DSM 1382 = ATCC 19364]